MTDSARQAEYEKVRDQYPMHSPGYTSATWFNAGWNGAAREIVRNLRMYARNCEEQKTTAWAYEAAANEIEKKYGV